MLNDSAAVFPRELQSLSKLLKKIAYFSTSLPLPPYDVGFLCVYTVRLGTTKQPNCFPSSLVIIFSDQHCSGGQGARKKARGEISSDVFSMVNQTKSSKMKFFFKLF